MMEAIESFLILKDDRDMGIQLAFPLTQLGVSSSGYPIKIRTLKLRLVHLVPKFRVLVPISNICHA